MDNGFWDKHYSYAKAGELLGCSRQNVYQECKRGRIPMERSVEGHPGVPRVWVEETLELRARGKR